MKKNTFFSYTSVLIVYFIAILLGKYTLDFLQLDSIYYEMLIADALVTAVVFLFSYLFKNSSIYDPYWSVIPLLIAIYWISLSPQGNEIRQVLVLSVISIWSFRLTFNWIRSWPNLEHEDWRYKKLKEDSGKLYWLVSFFGIHLFPTLIVFLGLSPVLPALQSQAPVSLFDMIGVLISISAVVIEYVSDEQLRKFKKENSTKAANMENGLWSVSRHPNYFGEILFWLGLFIIALSDGITSNGWTGIGFISMFLLFYFISIPMMEKRLVLNKNQYKEYQKKVPVLFPKIARIK